MINMILQKAYVFFFNNIFRFTRHISERTRNNVIQICLFMIAFNFALRPKTEDVRARMIFGSIITLIILLMSIKEELKLVKWDKIIYFSMVLLGCGILAIGQMHYVGKGYMLYGIDLAVLFPAFYLIWLNRGDHNVLYDRIAIAFTLAGLCTFFYGLVLACRGEYVIDINNRASGGSYNPNYLGTTGLTMYLSCQYLSLRTEKWSQAFIIAIAAGLGSSMMIESLSRAAMLSAAASSIILTVFIYKKKHQKNRGIYTQPGMLITVLMVAVIVAIMGLQIDELQLHSVQKSHGSNMVRLSSTKYECFVSNLSNEYITEEATEEEVAPISSRLQGTEDIDSFSSRRTVIWRAYLPHMNALGNDYREFKKMHPELKETRAHNNFIDYAFRCGIPVAAIYLIFYIAIGTKALLRIRTSKKQLSVWFLAITITGIYALYSMVEIATLAFIRVIPCLFFLTIAPLMGEKQSENVELVANTDDEVSDSIANSAEKNGNMSGFRSSVDILPPTERGRYL